MQDFLNEASTCSNARLSRRREPYAACDLLDERTVSSRDPVATSAGPRRTRSSSASTLSRPATSPRTCAAACTRRCWCGRRPSRPCPARRSWSSPGSGGRSRRWCSPGRWIRWRATRGWPPATSPPRSPGSVTSRVRAWCPSAGGLAAAAIAEDLIDEYRQFVNPVILGGGTPYFTPLAKPLDLRLIESRTFSSRVVYLSLPAHALSSAPVRPTDNRRRRESANRKPRRPRQFFPRLGVGRDRVTTPNGARGRVCSALRGVGRRIGIGELADCAPPHFQFGQFTLEPGAGRECGRRLRRRSNARNG